MQPTGKNTEESKLCRRPVYTALSLPGKNNRCPSAMRCFLAGSLAINYDKYYWNDDRRKKKSESAPNRSRTEDHPITSSLSYTEETRGSLRQLLKWCSGPKSEAATSRKRLQQWDSFAEPIWQFYGANWRKYSFFLSTLIRLVWWNLCWLITLWNLTIVLGFLLLILLIAELINLFLWRKQLAL